MINARTVFVIVLWLLLGTAAFLSGAALAGPFGFEMGMPHQDVTAGSQETDPGLYTPPRVLKKSPRFEIYLIQSTPETGLCGIRAVSQDIKTSKTGATLRHEFETLVQLLEVKYGKPVLYDKLSQDSQLSEPETFMLAMLKGDRHLAAVWKNSEAQRLPHDLSALFLETEALSPNSGVLRLYYEFENNEECQAVIRARKADPF